MSQIRKKRNISDTKQASDMSQDEEGPMTIDLAKEQEAAVASVSKKNPLTRSQQFKEAVLEKMAQKSKAGKKDSDSETEYHSGDDLDEDDDDEKKEGHEDEQGETQEDMDSNMEDEEVEIMDIKKNLAPQKKQTTKKAVTKSSVRSKRSASAGSTEKITYGVEKRVASTSRSKSLSQPKLKIAAVKTVVKPQRRSTGKSTTTKPATKRGADSDSASSSGFSNPKQRKNEEPELFLDLAPIRHENRMQEGSIHIGANVHVKWHNFRGTNYIMIRHVVNGVVDPRRGINISMDYIENLKTAVDTAYQCYVEASDQFSN